MKKYETLYKRIEKEIQTGVLREGSKLPSIRSEAEASGFSINTVVKAYELLTDEGFIRPRERGGYYIQAGSLKLTEEGIGTDNAVSKQFESTAREAGERIDQLYERLLHIDSSFACAAPGIDLLPVQQLRQAAVRLDNSWVEYNNPEGDLVLRRRLSVINHDTDGATSPEDIVVTNGATEALTIVLRSLLSPGDTVVLESPSYMNFFKQLAQLGVRIVEIPVKRDGLDLNLLEDEMKTHPVRMIIAQPHVQNPTGRTMSDVSKRELIRLAEKYNTYLVQDDVFGDLTYGPFRPRNLSSYSDYSGIILVSSYSKSISPGLRIGWIRSPHYAQQFSEEKLRTSMDTCRLSQAIISAYIGTAAHRRHLQSIRNGLKTRLQNYLQRLSEVLPEGSSVCMPSGGSLLWISYPKGINGTDVFERSAGKGLIAAPGELFSSSNYFNHFLRINAGEKLTQERADKLALLGEFPK